MPISELIDTHCHLDDFLKQNSLETVLQNAREHGIYRMINVSTHAHGWQQQYDLTCKYPNIAYTIGLHPSYVDENWHLHMITFQTCIQQIPAPIAIGEIGLDYHHISMNPSTFIGFKRLQQQAFETQLEYACQQKLPVIIHCRNAFEDCISIIKNSGIAWNQVVFHCFSYGLEEITKLLDLDAYASFTGIITYKNAMPVQKALIKQGLKRLMLETDAPYLAPSPHRGKQNEPAHISIIAHKAAELLHVSFETVAQVSTKNAETFFNLPAFVAS